MWRERIALLRRMPVHYRILFGSQLLFMTWAFTRRRKMIAAIEEQERLSGAAATQDPRQRYHEQMIKDKNNSIIKKDNSKA